MTTLNVVWKEGEKEQILKKTKDVYHFRNAQFTQQALAICLENIVVNEGPKGFELPQITFFCKAEHESACLFVRSVLECFSQISYDPVFKCTDFPHFYSLMNSLHVAEDKLKKFRDTPLFVAKLDQYAYACTLFPFRKALPLSFHVSFRELWDLKDDEFGNRVLENVNGLLTDSDIQSAFEKHLFFQNVFDELLRLKASRD